MGKTKRMLSYKGCKIKMSTFKTYEEAEKYGIKNYFIPNIKRIKSRKHDTIRFEVKDLWK